MSLRSMAASDATIPNPTASLAGGVQISARILETGLVLSEYPPGTPPHMSPPNA